MDQETILREIVRRIVEVAHPRRVLLFGSAARNQMGPESDLDLLVITGGPVHRRNLEQGILRRLSGVGHAVDVVVATPDDVERYGQSPYLIYKSALREGKAVYDDAETVPTR